MLDELMSYIFASFKALSSVLVSDSVSEFLVVSVMMVCL